MARATYRKLILAIDNNRVCPCSKPPKQSDVTSIVNFLKADQAEKQKMVPGTTFYTPPPPSAQSYPLSQPFAM